MQWFSCTVTFTDRSPGMCSGNFNWATLIVNTIHQALDVSKFLMCTTNAVCEDLFGDN